MNFVRFYAIVWATTVVANPTPQQVQPLQLEPQQIQPQSRAVGELLSAYFAVQSTSVVTVTSTETVTNNVKQTCMIVPPGLQPCPRMGRKLNFFNVDPSPVQPVESTVGPRSTQYEVHQWNQDQQKDKFPQLRSSQAEPGEFGIIGMSDHADCFNGLLEQQRGGERLLLTIVSFTTKTDRITQTVTNTLPMVPGSFVGFQVAGCIPNLNYPRCPMVPGNPPLVRPAIANPQIFNPPIINPPIIKPIIVNPPVVNPPVVNPPVINPPVVNPPVVNPPVVNPPVVNPPVVNPQV